MSYASSCEYVVRRKNKNNDIIFFISTFVPIIEMGNEKE